LTKIVTNLKWEDEFKTQGIESLADFKAVIEEANGIDQAFSAPPIPNDRK
jgi:hypothetical protein